MECALTLMQGFGLVVDCSAPRCVDKAFRYVSIYCDSALPLAKSQRCSAVKRPLRELIDAPAAHMQTNIENAAHADLMLIDLGKTEKPT